jgi:hypothetical protein
MDSDFPLAQIAEPSVEAQDRAALLSALQPPG